MLKAIDRQQVESTLLKGNREAKALILLYRSESIFDAHAQLDLSYYSALVRLRKKGYLLTSSEARTVRWCLRPEVTEIISDLEYRNMLSPLLTKNIDSVLDTVGSRVNRGYIVKLKVLGIPLIHMRGSTLSIEHHVASTVGEARVILTSYGLSEKNLQTVLDIYKTSKQGNEDE